MTREALENAILYMINTYLESELISREEVETVLANVRNRALERESL
jgi:hypothetical protein